MIPQHQTKNKETTRVVNYGRLDRPVLVRLGEERRLGGGWDWLIQVIVLGVREEKNKFRINPAYWRAESIPSLLFVASGSPSSARCGAVSPMQSGRLGGRCLIEQTGTMIYISTTALLLH